MLGPTNTAMRPETEPRGIVIVIEVSDQATIGTATLLSMTALLPWDAPKPEPVMTS